jgi:hypothetical protein
MTARRDNRGSPHASKRQVPLSNAWRHRFEKVLDEDVITPVVGKPRSMHAQDAGASPE